MGKYIEVFKIGVKEQMAYKIDMLMTALFSAFRILLAYILWSAIFADNERVGGYTFAMMMTYYLFVSFAVQLNKTSDVVFQFAGEIKSGQFSKYVVRPISPIGVFTALAASKSAVVLTINAVAFALYGLLMQTIIYIPRMQDIGIALLFLLVGLMIINQLYYMITMFSFKIIEIAGLLFAVMNVISFLSGELIPLNMLPEGIEMIVRALPFYYTIYFPASILLGQESAYIVQGFGVQLLWLLILASANQLMYKKLFRHYEGVGV